VRSLGGSSSLGGDQHSHTLSSLTKKQKVRYLLVVLYFIDTMSLYDRREGEGALGAAVRPGISGYLKTTSSVETKAFPREERIQQQVLVNYLSNSPGGTFTGVNVPGGKLPGYSTA